MVPSAYAALIATDFDSFVGLMCGTGIETYQILRGWVGLFAQMMLSKPQDTVASPSSTFDCPSDGTSGKASSEILDKSIGVLFKLPLDLLTGALCRTEASTLKELQRRASIIRLILQGFFIQDSHTVQQEPQGSLADPQDPQSVLRLLLSCSEESLIDEALKYRDERATQSESKLSNIVATLKILDSWLAIAIPDRYTADACIRLAKQATDSIRALCKATTTDLTGPALSYDPSFRAAVLRVVSTSSPSSVLVWYQDSKRNRSSKSALQVHHSSSSSSVSCMMQSFVSGLLHLVQFL